MILHKLKLTTYFSPQTFQNGIPAVRLTFLAALPGLRFTLRSPLNWKRAPNVDILKVSKSILGTLELSQLSSLKAKFFHPVGVQTLKRESKV